MNRSKDTLTRWERRAILRMRVRLCFLRITKTITGILRRLLTR